MTKPKLRDQVTSAIETYLHQLDGFETSNLYDLVINEIEAPLIETILRHTKYNQSTTANILGLSRGTLRKKIRALNIAIKA